MATDSAPLTWPEGWLDPGAFARQWALIRPAFLAAQHRHRIPATRANDLARVYLPLAAWVAARKQDGPLIIGVNGAQGSGKSTLCDFLRLILEQCHGQRVAVLSIDDLYLTRTERQTLASEVHPLLITRGVPGTHDVTLGLATLQRLRTATETDLTPLPAFDKASDDRRPAADWPMFLGRPDILLFEGWCVGTTPQADAELIEPVNALERDEDADGRWRHFVNRQLETAYRHLFAELDRLIFLSVPDMERVLEWRTLQEQKLAATAGAGQHIMEAAALRRFVMHYERLTRHNLAELPARADVTLSLNDQHGFGPIAFRAMGEPPGAETP
jgi:D-glycerate 3-kinase